LLSSCSRIATDGFRDRGAGARGVGTVPSADAAFRRRIWSHVHFPEEETRVLDRLSGRSFGVAIDVGAVLGASKKGNVLLQYCNVTPDLAGAVVR